MVSNELFVCVLVIFTSAMACYGGRRIAGLSPVRLQTALWEFIGCLGAFAVFLLVNLMLGLAMVFMIRGTLGFMSVYVLADMMLVLLSALQGFIFQLWWLGSSG
jgi:hypothetical protein